MSTELAGIPKQSKQIGLTPQNIDEALRLADVMAKSSIVPREYQGNPGNILVAIQWGAEIGLPPLQAMQNIAVINGRPAIWGDAVLAIVRASGLLESITEDITDTCATCTVQRRGELPTARTFTLEDAKKAGLLGKQGPWSQYQRRMLQMRARAWALRDVFPDVLRGVSVAEEAQDIPTERSMGPAQVVDPPPAPAGSRADAVKARLRKLAAPPAEETATPAPGLREVLERIHAAATGPELGEAAQLAAQLAADADKTTARAAYAARREHLATTSLPGDAGEAEVEEI